MRAPSGGNAILSDAASGADDVLGASWRRRRNGGGRAAVMVAVNTPLGAGIDSLLLPSRSKASNRIGAAASRPIRPGVGPLSGGPAQTPIVVRLSKPIASASRKP